VLQANTFILSRLTGDRELQEYVAPPEGIIADQLQGLRALVDSIIGDLAGASRFVNGPWFVQEDDSFESKVQARALTVIVAFAEKAAAYAVGLADIAVSSMPIFGKLKTPEAIMRKQWLLAYAMTAATMASACNSMVNNGFMAYGNISVLENRGQAGPAQGPEPGPAGARRN